MPQQSSTRDQPSAWRFESAINLYVAAGSRAIQRRNRIGFVAAMEQLKDIVDHCTYPTYRKRAHDNLLALKHRWDAQARASQDADAVA